MFLFRYATSSRPSCLLFPYSLPLPSGAFRTTRHVAHPYTPHHLLHPTQVSWRRNPGRTPTLLLSVLLLTLINLLATPIAAAGDDCYWRASNTITPVSPGWFACNNTQVQPSGAQLCCISGSQCGEQSICHSNTGYYVGGCTDGSYGDAVCRTDCCEWRLLVKLLCMCPSLPDDRGFSRQCGACARVTAD